MSGLLLLVASIALADSLNPTTIAPAIYLATTNRSRAGLASYIGGVFGVYMVGGLLLTLGPGQLLLSAVPRPGPEAKHVIELCVGAVALTFAGVVWLGRDRIRERTLDARAAGPRSAFFLGAGITAVELPTAFPYFAAIAAIVGSGQAVPAQVALLIVFNILFVAPLIAILVFRLFAGRRAVLALNAFGDWLQRWGPLLLASLAGGVGVVSLALGGTGLASSR